VSLADALTVAGGIGAGVEAIVGVGAAVGFAVAVTLGAMVGGRVATVVEVGTAAGVFVGADVAVAAALGSGIGTIVVVGTGAGTSVDAAVGTAASSGGMVEVDKVGAATVGGGVAIGLLTVGAPIAGTTRRCADEPPRTIPTRIARVVIGTPGRWLGPVILLP